MATEFKVAPVKKNILSIDPGNSYLKICFPDGSLKMTPNYLLAFDPTEHEIKPTDDSAVVLVDGKHWLVGAEAKQQGGSALNHLGKCDHIHIVVAAVLSMLETTTAIVTELRIVVADNRLPKWKEAKERLLKLKDFQAMRTVGTSKEYAMTSYKPRIDDVRFTSEGQPPWFWMTANNLWNTALNADVHGVLDVGCGETTGKLITKSGTPIYGTEKSKAMNDPGMISLANSCAAKIKIAGNLDVTPDAYAVLAAIERGCKLPESTKGGRFNYTDRGSLVSFDDIFDNAHAKWMARTVNKMLDTFQSSGEHVGQILIVGGGAPLFEAAAKQYPGLMLIAKHDKIDNFPQLINVVAMSTVMGA